LAKPSLRGQRKLSEDADAAFRATYAELYDRHLVPLLFAPYAGYLADRIKAHEPRSVLETAAGTGILTQALVQALPAEVTITATDLNQPMIDRARAKFAGPRIAWQQADAMRLPFSNESFELIVCQFGVMFFPDKQASFREAARVLTPCGRYLFAVWDDWKKMPDAPLGIAADVVAAMLNCDPASLVNPGYHDEMRLREDLASAQFQQIKVERVMLPAAAASAREAALASVHGSLIRTVIETQHPGRLVEATNAVERAFEAQFGKGAVAGRTSALIVTAERNE
jgi:SAM-dependent methyltransferase